MVLPVAPTDNTRSLFALDEMVAQAIDNHLLVMANLVEDDRSGTRTMEHSRAMVARRDRMTPPRGECRQARARLQPMAFRAMATARLSITP
jgi:hypothetical protein